MQKSFAGTRKGRHSLSLAKEFGISEQRVWRIRPALRLEGVSGLWNNTVHTSLDMAQAEREVLGWMCTGAPKRGPTRCSHFVQQERNAEIIRRRRVEKACLHWHEHLG